MNRGPTPLNPRAALFIGAALFSTPVLGQETPAQTAPPAPVVAPPPAATPERAIQIAPSAPIVQPVPDVPKPQTPPSYATERAPRAAPVPTRAAAPAREARSVTRSVTRAAPVAASAPTAPAVPPSAPVATSPEPVALPTQSVETDPLTQNEVAPLAPETAPAAETSTATQETSNNNLWWILGLGALALIVLALLLSRRRRDPEPERVYVDPVVTKPAEPVAMPAEPIAVIPVPVVENRLNRAPIVEPEVREKQAVVAAADDVSVSTPAKEDLVGVADAVAPVARRPWIELGMRPIRAGTSTDEALVDFELTVGNSGDTAAKDVRISTFMLTDMGSESDLERVMSERRDDSAVSPVTIEPGEGTRIDAHLTMPKGDLGRNFHPVVVADARYTLPDGSQGRTCAAFRIGSPGDGSIQPLASGPAHVTETVEAELVGKPERA